MMSGFGSSARTLIGALAFDHLPDTWAVLGMAVIMLSGAALAWSQNRK